MQRHPHKYRTIISVVLDSIDKKWHLNSPFGAVDMLLDMDDESGLLSGCGFGKTFLGIVPFCTSFASLSTIASSSL